jgi:hypothetical protein
MPSPSHSSRFYQPHNTGWGVQIMLYEWYKKVIYSILRSLR